MKNIVIRPVLNGYSVDVGCQTVVFTSKKALLSELSDYLDSPEKVESRFLKEAVNPMDGRTPAPCDPCVGSEAPGRVLR